MSWLSIILKAFARPFQWWIVVAPWEHGLRVRLGKVSKLLLPGIHFRIPFLDRIYTQSIRLRTIWDGCQTITSADGFCLTVGISIDFIIADLKELFNSLSAPEATLRFHAASAVTEFVSSKNRADINSLDIEKAVNNKLSNFNRGLASIEAHVTAFAFAKTYRLLMNDYSHGAGLHQNFDQEPGAQK